MSRIPFDEKELQVIGTHRTGATEMFRNMGIELPEQEPLFNRPITAKENYRLLFTGKKPYWVPTAGWAFCDVNVFRPRMNPDNVATHIIFDGEPPYEYESNTMRSTWFDLDWVYVPVAAGATVQPGSPSSLPPCANNSIINASRPLPGKSLPVAGIS